MAGEEEEESKGNGWFDLVTPIYLLSSSFFGYS